jgi:hypothetical protein
MAKTIIITQMNCAYTKNATTHKIFSIHLYIIGALIMETCELILTER